MPKNPSVISRNGWAFVRGLVFSPGKIGKKRYYGVKSVLDPERTTLPDEKTRRGRAMELVRGAVTAFGRSVRLGDILTYIEGTSEARDLNPSTIMHDILSLAETKNLQVIGVVRGEGKGHNLYLPAELDSVAYAPKGPLTWIEEVAQAFADIWDEHLRMAKEEGRLPRPVSTGEVRARWSTTPGAHPKSRERQPVVDAMQMLALNSRAQPPLVRKIRRKGEKAILWVPVDVPSKELDLGHTYATNTERVGTAVRRAFKHLGRPVTVRDVSDEIELDPSLRPVRLQSLFSILTDISKERVDVVGAERKKRSTRRVYKVGMLGNEAYYYHRKEGLSEAKAYVELCRIESHWDSMSAGERLNALDKCYLPSAAVGQALLIAAEAEELRRRLDDFLPRKMDWSTRREAESVRCRVDDVLHEVRPWLGEHGLCTLDLPHEVSREVPCWTSHELLDILRPLYPVLRKNNDNTQLITLLYDCVRRVPNPGDVNRFSKEPLEAAEFLFDRADVLLYAAQKWGGHECRFLARTARGELGWLRDARFILPALQAGDMKARLAAVACLAFLWSDESSRRLRELFIDDPEPGVRQSALWAYGFAGGKDVQELLSERSGNDANVHVRTFAKKATTLDERGWWAF
ncbi:MAG TPA: HEAT repeat domain-containing protein [Pyrinomonadaceae bacterium]|jgi:hypothetical protein|nr:HEAT repeat domain-containing protein [Pyrinomonadaceae bacterium]